MQKSGTRGVAELYLFHLGFAHHTRLRDVVFFSGGVWIFWILGGRERLSMLAGISIIWNAHGLRFQSAYGPICVLTRSKIL